MNKLVHKAIDETFSYNYYIELFEKYRHNDWREIKFQNEVIKPFIRSVCPNLDIEECSAKGKDSKIHEYTQYCGIYKGDDGKYKTTTPDLVITKVWKWENIENKLDYRAVVEVKSPCLSGRLYNKEYKQYDHEQLKRYSNAKNNKKIILTDGLKWVFFKKTNHNNLKHLVTFELYNLIYSNKTKKTPDWEWKKEDLEVTVNKSPQNNMTPIKVNSLSDFEKLKEYLYKFLNEPK